MTRPVSPIGWMPQWNYTKFQWQPTLTAHDPNPPITLENGATITETDAASAGVATVSGVAAAVFAGVASSSGAATVSGVAAAVSTAVVTTDGIASVSGEANAIAAAVGASEGVATVTGESDFSSVEPAAVVAEPIRNFRAYDDRYDWLRQHRKKENEAEDLREEIVQVSVELEERIEQAADDQAEIAARLQLKIAQEHYLSTFENAYREDMREALIEQWREEVSYQKYLVQVKRRAALLLLLAH